MKLSIDMSNSEIKQLAEQMSVCFKVNHPNECLKLSEGLINWFKKRSQYSLKALRDKFNERQPQNESQLGWLITEVRREYEQRVLQGLED